MNLLKIYKARQQISEFNDSDVLEIADQIEFYLKNYPNAVDTIEGITKWWLLGQEFEVLSLIV